MICLIKISGLTNKMFCDKIYIEKGKTSNGYAKKCYKITLLFSDCGGYFFMVITISNRIVINNMYSLSIAFTSFQREVKHNRPALRRFQSYLIGIIRHNYFSIYYVFCQLIYSWGLKNSADTDFFPYVCIK